MSEKTRAQLTEETQALHRRLAEHEHALAQHQRAEQSAHRRIAELEQLLKESRKTRQLHQDLAEHSQRAEQSLKRSEEICDLLCTHGSDLIVRLGGQEKLLFLSPACASLLGYQPAELVGRVLWDFLAVDDRKQLKRAAVALLPERQAFTFRFLHKQGQYVSLQGYGRVVPHPQTGEPEWLGIVRVQSSFSAATPVDAPQEQARLARLSSLAEGVSGLVHELNQPLTTIATYAQACLRLLSRKEIDVAEISKAITQVAQQSERAAAFVRRLRGYLLQGQTHRSTIDINVLIEETLQLVEREVQIYNVAVRCALADDLPTLLGDGIQVGQVVLNLLRNALDAMTQTPPEARTLTIASRSLGDEVEVTVSDSGPGLAVDMVQRLFQPFQTTKPQGMGLGLALSRSVIQAHGGRLWVKPNEKRGTSFSFTLPVTHNHEPQSNHLSAR